MIMSTSVKTLGKYYATYAEACAAAREMSKTSTCNVFVRESYKGLYLSPFGLPESTCFFNGRSEDEITYAKPS